MKKIVNSLLLILVLIFTLLYTKYYLESDYKNYQESLYVYNWGEYIDPQVITDFEDLYNIDVIYETYDSNETLYTKLQNKTTRYDVVFPSEYMVDKLNDNNLLLELDYNKIPNIKDVDPNLLKANKDQVVAPYFWGTVGIVYDTTKTDLTFDSWNDLWDESLKNQVILSDSSREVLGMSLESLGYSVNTTNEIELKLAQEKLISLRPNIKAIIGDEILQIMPAGEATAALTWSGSAKYMMEQNPNLAYSIPDEGTNVWVDSAVIPSVCENIEGAHKFINYLLDSEISKRNSDYVGYSTTNIITKDMIKKEEGYNEIFYPDINDHKFEFYQNLDLKDNMMYNDLFLEFKMF